MSQPCACTSLSATGGSAATVHTAGVTPTAPLDEAQQHQHSESVPVLAAAVEHGPKPLDETCFPSFAPLIHACQPYAKLSGCRFSIAAFDGIDCNPATHVPVVTDARAQDAGPLLSAKLRAVPIVRSFTEQLRSHEPDLLKDLAKAYDLVIKESVRNGLIASCKAADFFPPPSPPPNVDDEDCCWDEAGSFSAAVTAQRLYNDEVRRLHDAEQLVISKTASFIVEFADEVGVGLPQMPAERIAMLQNFQQDLAEWTDASYQLALGQSENKPPLKALLQDVGEVAGWLSGGAVSKLQDGMVEHKDTILWGGAALVALGAVGLAAKAGARVARRR